MSPREDETENRPGEVESIDWRAAAASGKPDLQIHVLYTLSEEGRKAALLSGGNGHYMQLITYDLYSRGGHEKALMKLAHVHEDGQIIIYLTDWNPREATFDSFARVVREQQVGDVPRLFANIKRNDGKRCPRRVVHFVRGGAEQQAEAYLVPLNHESQENRFSAAKYDYDLPFDEDSMLPYLLSLEAEQARQLEVAQAEANRQNQEALYNFFQDQAAGRVKLLEWLKHPEENAILFDKVEGGPIVSNPWGAMFGDDLHKYPLDEDSYVVMKEELDRRIQENKDRDARTAQARHEADLKVIAAKRADMDLWVARKGSKHLRDLFKAELYDPAIPQYHEERAAEVKPGRNEGFPWYPVKKDLITEAAVGKPKGEEVARLLEIRAAFPEARVRLAKLNWKHGPSIEPTPVSLVTECPWDDELVIACSAG
jgi:hypothetical protein